MDGKCMRFITNATGLSPDYGFMRDRDSGMELYARGFEISRVEDTPGVSWLRLDSIDCIEMQLSGGEAEEDCTEELLRLWAYADSWV
jgi:hypothetical protein